ncbi:BZ3500_MvSof-1268-A1-R1_Chr2-2g04847 [Microbotryum saponariae]|uniref:BZ3500_MvSof-1268-A1-R1_Chr2-2g04847 protein n=1 Tax=Microbotryum saponariae TaxID=289078 RepID=A0A2X0KMT4_9BASI|nr:BZ3500_MvSof-1268-A1-R1_Chr2-2g04847 [Microbotryum saponariae]SDA00313.1 BZ3501_MvSof-1269-A2-R1_Chr2-2g04521 [Microbotryum saponariae]
MSHLHPLAGPLLPYLQKYPPQASSLFQAYQDLYLAQTWQDLELVDLPSCECVVIKGRPQKKVSCIIDFEKTHNAPISCKVNSAPLRRQTVASFALPINLSTATSLRSSVSQSHPREAPYRSTNFPRHLHSLSNIFEALDKLPSETKVSATDTQTESPTIYLAIAERDSSIVYYVLRHGIVSPKEVPE